MPIEFKGWLSPSARKSRLMELLGATSRAVQMDMLATGQVAAGPLTPPTTHTDTFKPCSWFCRVRFALIA
eukprot:5051705-Pyramimonas_sp.AAC.2